MFDTDTIAYLDLEQTIIASFSDPYLCNVDKIHGFLNTRDIDGLHIFSFAISNEADKDEFVRRIKPKIENALGLPVLSWPSLRDMIRVERYYSSIDFGVHDYLERGKQEAFANYIRGTCKFRRAVLIDDTVPDISIKHRTHGWEIEFWNVDSL